MSLNNCPFCNKTNKSWEVYLNQVNYKCEECNILYRSFNDKNNNNIVEFDIYISFSKFFLDTYKIRKFIDKKNFYEFRKPCYENGSYFWKIIFFRQVDKPSLDIFKSIIQKYINLQ